jgi:hypothetical protein
MRIVIIGLTLLALLWSGYWAFGARTLDREVADWFAEGHGARLQAEAADVAVRGFPNRFDLTVTEPRIADPARGAAWSAPFVQVLALSYRPWHIIVAFPDMQLLTTAGRELQITSRAMRASVRVEPSTALALAEAVFEADAIEFGGAEGRLAAGRSVLALRADETRANGYQLALSVADLAPDAAGFAERAAAAQLPPQVATMTADVDLLLTAPLDRTAQSSRPEIAEARLASLRVVWGDLVLGASGTIAPDAAGFAAGTIELDIANWQRLVPALVAFGMVQQDFAPTLDRFLGALAAEGGGVDGNLRVPLRLDGGFMTLGPLPLGAAPRLSTPRS